MRLQKVLVGVLLSILLFTTLSYAQVSHEERDNGLQKLAVFSWFGNGEDIPDDSVEDSYIPDLSTIEGWTLTSSTSACTCVINVWSDVKANFPPTSADNIAASASPSLTAATMNSASTVPTWSRVIKRDSFIRAIYDSGDCTGLVTLTIYGYH